MSSTELDVARHVDGPVGAGDVQVRCRQPHRIGQGAALKQQAQRLASRALETGSGLTTPSAI